MLDAAAIQALGDERIRERLANDAQFVQGSTPAEFGRFLNAQLEAWRPVLSRMEVPLN
jgi:tripartite-type tricarboxylate transporter receptor subunit TctC